MIGIDQPLERTQFTKNIGTMKILNPKNRFYQTHSDNVSTIIVSAHDRDLAEKLVDLYVDVVNGTSSDPRSTASHLKESA